MRFGGPEEVFFAVSGAASHETLVDEVNAAVRAFQAVRVPRPVEHF